MHKYHLNVVFVLIHLLRMVICRCTNHHLNVIFANTFTENGHLKILKLSFKCDICAYTFTKNGHLEMHKN